MKRSWSKSNVWACEGVFGKLERLVLKINGCYNLNSYNTKKDIYTMKDEKKQLLPTLAIMGTIIFWGLSFVSSKAILNTGVPPMTMVFLRFLSASIILYPLFKRIEPNVKILPQNRISLILSGVFGISVYFYFEATGIKLTTVSNASMIIATIPVLTLIVDYVLYNTPLTWYKTTGILLSVAGVFIIIGRPGHEDPSTNVLAGNLLMLGACLCWVTYNLFSKSLKVKYSGLTITTNQCIYGMIFLIPLALLEYRQWIPISLPAALNILYLAVFCSAVSYFLYIYALSHLGPVTVTSFLNLVPVVSVTGGIIFLQEQISLPQILGGIIVLTGVYIVNHKNGRKTRFTE
jgi:drug/metabolite transporter (DMT)-like permease